MTDLSSLAADIRKARAESADELYRDRIEAFSEAVNLDDSVLRSLRDHGLSGAAEATPRREPVSQGMGSYWLCRLDVAAGDGNTVQLMEKAVEADGPEARFWRSADEFQMSGRRFSSIAPLFSVRADPITILYLPYRDGVNKSKVASKRNFRANIDDLVRAVAEFNATNIATIEGVAKEPRIAPTRKDAPSIRDICDGLGLPSRHAARLMRNVCLSIDARWSDLEDMYDSVPATLCHNDIGPGNAIVISGQTNILDFEKAGVAAVGSDMHTILRWGGKCLEDETEAERLLQLYADEVRTIRPEITAEQIRVGTWVTFFTRYSSIAKWRSARNLDSFALALLKAGELLEGRR